MILFQIVGNLLYYRYINPAIVAPDVFDIINIAADKALTSDQRRNLGSVAKILQFAAANKGVSVCQYTSCFSQTVFALLVKFNILILPLL